MTTQARPQHLDPIEFIEELEQHNSIAWMKKFIPIYLFHFVFLRLA